MIGRWLSKLAPAYLREEAVTAEHDADTAKTLLEATKAREATVNELAARMTYDRHQNHYADRVRAAFAGRNP